MVARLARAEVPKVAVVVRKAYGGGHIALGGRPDPPGPAAGLADRRDGLHGARTPACARSTGASSRRPLAAEGREAHDALVAELATEWARESEPWEAAANIYLDDVIDPRTTREAVATGIDFAWGSGPRVSKART